MVVPKDFVALCSYFHQDIDLMGSTGEDWIAYALQNLDARQMVAAKHFISRLLAANIEDAEFLGIWNTSGAEIGFGSARDLRVFLTKIRDMIDEVRKKSL